MGLGRGVYHHATDPSGRALGQALTAATAVSAFAWITYDGLGFRLNAGLAFILMGAAGALWRLEVGRLHWGANVDHSRPVVLREDGDPAESAGPAPEPVAAGDIRTTPAQDQRGLAPVGSPQPDPPGGDPR